MDGQNTDPRLPQATAAQLREGYLDHLSRMLSLRRDHFDEINDAGLKLLDHSIFVTYCDCIKLGERAEASRLLEETGLTLIPTVA